MEADIGMLFTSKQTNLVLTMDLQRDTLQVGEQ